MAREFNGSSTYFSVADDAALSLPNGDWTLGGWVKIDSNVGSSYQFLYGRYIGGGTDYVMWILGEDSVGINANKLWFFAIDGGQFVTLKTNDTPGQDSDWQHICVVRSGVSFTQYVNGSANGVSNNGNMGEISQAADVYFGTRWDQEATRFLDGHMAEWAKWDVALSAEQRAALIDGVRPVDVGPRPAWYLPMLGSLDEEVEGLAVTNNGTTISEHPPAIIPPGVPLELRTIPAAGGGAYKIAAADAHAAGAAVGETFSTGATIGQVNGY